ncbi:uncharacterized protein N0V89_007781 [Didymosphaeria variabile]|uniref:Choline monooxygenase, chloroplastic n=1 Tax=Didymosphaeria variabile TaxID=1932322 RepID=A0A9W9CAL4_9PLEO|nr:uncharacterized protein N0V89_007781 [Didymosphaeria variabile]KAJ4352433.1 hypothetical protein N0V89_007781 [Didymosphaeria variabile]
MLSLFNSSSLPTAEKPKDEVKRALPASWYHSGPLYDLERRAIFSKRWLLVTHSLRFDHSGDYVSFREAGFDFFLVKDREVAFPVVTEESGSASILSCKYHGWSYGFKGNLAKAPQFASTPGFDKAQHSLFPVHVHVDGMGFVWVNMDANETPEVEWKSDFEGVDTQDRLNSVDLKRDFQYDHQWHMIGEYNWKTLADNYNECYHCLTGHPAVANVIDLQSYYVDTKKGYILHYNTSKDPEEADNAATRPHFFFMQRAVPISATQTRMEYEVYRKKGASDEDFKAIDAYFKTVMQEDKVLCNGAQRNLSGGVFTNGQLHPEKEKGPIWFQDKVRGLLISHREKEEKENGDLWKRSDFALR